MKDVLFSCKAYTGNRGEFLYIGAKANMIIGSPLVKVFILVTLLMPLDSDF